MNNIPQRIRYGRPLAIGGVIFVAVALGYFASRWHVRASAAGTLQLAERYLRQRDNARARETLKWLHWFEPANHQALLISGISLNADRKFLEAIEILERIPEDSESFDQGGIALAASLIFDDQLDRAESVLKRHLSRFPQSTDACERLVRLHLKLLRQRDAAALLMAFWHRAPEDSWALPHLLELEVKAVNAHTSVAYLEMVDRKHPHQATVELALARAFSLMGKTQEATIRFESALQLRPQDSATRILAAEFFLNTGELEKSRNLLKLDSADALRDERYWFVRCRIAEQTGEIESAYSDLQKALTLRPNDESYILMQATLLRRLGRTQEARLAAQQATQFAENRKQLMILSNQLDRTNPSHTHCREIADLLQRLGHSELAAAWRRVGESVAPVDAAQGA